MIMYLRTWVAIVMGHGFGLPSWVAVVGCFFFLDHLSFNLSSIYMMSERENDFCWERKERESEREEENSLSKMEWEKEERKRIKKDFF